MDTGEKNLKRPVALLVEDDTGIAYLLEFVLAKEGYQVVLARDGTAAAGRIKEDPAPDIVILDIMLPGQDGISLLRQIKARADWSRTPVIMLSAKGEEDTVSQAMALGADDYVSKPFDPVDFVKRLQRHRRASAA